MKWFKHDSDAHRDVKLRRVQMKYGMEGYGLYWYLLENIASNLSEHNLTFELEHDSEIIAADTGIHHERVEEIIMFMVRQGLFEESQGVISCLKLLKRLDTSMTSNKKFRSDIAKAKEKHGLIVVESGQSHDPIMAPSCQSPDGVMQEEKRREEKRKTTPRKRGFPSDFEVSEKMADWVEEKYPALDWVDATEKWINAMQSQGRKYVDWAAAWRNGMGKADEWRAERAPAIEQGGVRYL